MNKVISFFSEVRLELSKVTWPKREEVVRLTFVVVLIAAIVGSYIGAVDFTLTKLLETILSI